MAGIYIHIPFCARRCIYCGFYSTLDSQKREQYTKALCRELEMEKQWLGGARVTTLYLGGGTPSQLSPDQLAEIMEAVRKYPSTDRIEELTIECNPDDITPEFVNHAARLGFNRISMGVQSFDDGMLRFLRRRHSASQAIQAVRTCQECGIDNISIDLMYGLPGQTMEMHESSIEQAIGLGVAHISSYCLSFEPGSPLERLREKGMVTPATEETCESMFNTLCGLLGKAGYEHYEISNFCKEGKQSRHNSSYWTGTPYLGIGAAAHSYCGRTRRWNPEDIDIYIRSMENGERCSQSEQLTESDLYNEYVMLGLRTSAGISMDHVLRQFGQEYSDLLARESAPFIRSGRLIKEEDCLRFPQDSLFISDSIISSLFHES